MGEKSVHQADIIVLRLRGAAAAKQRLELSDGTRHGRKNILIQIKCSLLAHVILSDCMGDIDGR